MPVNTKHEEVEQFDICIMCNTLRPRSQVIRVGKGKNTRCKTCLREQYANMSDSDFEKRVWSTTKNAQ